MSKSPSRGLGRTPSAAEVESAGWLVAESEDLFIAFNADGRVAHANRAFEAVLGWTAAALASLDAQTLLHPEDALSWQSALSGTNAALHARFKSALGDWVSLCGRGRASSGGGVMALLRAPAPSTRGQPQSTQDQALHALGDLASQRRRSAQALTRRLKLAVTAAKAAVFEIDFKRRTVWCGPEFSTIVGRSLSFEEAAGPWPHVHPDDAAAFDALKSAGRASFDIRLLSDDGARWVRADVESVHDRSGRVQVVVGLVTDIDDRKRQELALAEAERQAKVATVAKSHFLANISHEIRTPMNGVLGVLQLIKREKLDPDDIHLLNEGLASGRMLTELLDDLLDFSNIETGRFDLHLEPLDPAEVLLGVTSLLEPAASAKGLTMRADAATDLGMIKADPLRLRQALYNIMGNAVKFTPSGSVQARLTRCQTADGSRLRFEVKDTGVGVPEGAQTTLFERFEQADGSMSRPFGGSGLGLAITKRLAEKMGGSVGFSSQPGQGSTFWLEIAAEAADVRGEPEAPTEIGDFRVLLVEDNATNRLVISKLLQALGIVVEVAEDGEAGVAAAAKGGFDLVLMDIQMPGMNGMEATRRIRAMGGRVSETPVVAITANVMAEQRSDYAAAGMDGVVSKPVSAAALLSEITRVSELRAAA